MQTASVNPMLYKMTLEYSEQEMYSLSGWVREALSLVETAIKTSYCFIGIQLWIFAFSTVAVSYYKQISRRGYFEGVY